MDSNLPFQKPASTALGGSGGCHVLKKSLNVQQGVQHPPLFFSFFRVFPRFFRKNRSFFTPIFTIKR